MSYWREFLGTRIRSIMRLTDWLPMCLMDELWNHTKHETTHWQFVLNSEIVRTHAKNWKISNLSPHALLFSLKNGDMKTLAGPISDQCFLNYHLRKIWVVDPAFAANVMNRTTTLYFIYNPTTSSAFRRKNLRKVIFNKNLQTETWHKWQIGNWGKERYQKSLHYFATGK